MTITQSTVTVEFVVSDTEIQVYLTLPSPSWTVARIIDAVGGTHDVNNITRFLVPEDALFIVARAIENAYPDWKIEKRCDWCEHIHHTVEASPDPTIRELVMVNICKPCYLDAAMSV